MNVIRTLSKKVVLLIAVGLIVASVGAGVAFARGNAMPIGTGIVVVNTNLAYQGAQAAGTGMVLTSSGEVLTNNHVINGATTIKVTVPKTGRIYTARVVGYNKTADVAVLQLQGASNLKTISTSTAKLSVGAAVTALGNAGGTGTIASVTGRITGLGKTITAADDSGSEQLTGLIETNAPIQPGDSGGPLENSHGKVVGMDTAGSTSSGFGFQSVSRTDAYAIPIGKAVTIANAIVAGKASATIHIGATAFFGIQVASASTPGALIAGVVPGGPADSAGLVAGDLITAINGAAIASPASVGTFVLTQKPGATVTVTYLDQLGSSQTATVTLGSGPDQ
jgi:S1-C subfamily serine protease